VGYAPVERKEGPLNPLTITAFGAWQPPLRSPGVLPSTERVQAICCSKCHEILSELKQIAAFALDHEAGAVENAIDPLRLALYESRVVPDADEGALPMRLALGQGRAPTDGREERWMKGHERRARPGARRDERLDARAS